MDNKKEDIGIDMPPEQLSAEKVNASSKVEATDVNAELNSSE
mgnify:CR=1 FL=1